ncbi:MAG TPA: hypothetical protein VFI28_01505 [Candidatus Limnocylindrales bacterium]|nr:hypothetical protein [Candidatus Limnocylindrales bacterium]
MHLQVRSSVRTASGGSVGAEKRLGDVIQADPIGVRPGALRAMLEVLRRADVNLRMAGGHSIETTGEFVFAVDADEEHDEQQTYAARDALRAAGYPADVVEVHHADLEDTAGALEQYISSLGGDELVHEIFVGTPGRGARRVPVQVTTMRFEAG